MQTRRTLAVDQHLCHSAIKVVFRLSACLALAASVVACLVAAAQPGMAQAGWVALTPSSMRMPIATGATEPA